MSPTINTLGNLSLGRSAHFQDCVNECRKSAKLRLAVALTGQLAACSRFAAQSGLDRNPPRRERILEVCYLRSHSIEPSVAGRMDRLRAKFWCWQHKSGCHTFRCQLSGEGSLVSGGSFQSLSAFQPPTNCQLSVCPIAIEPDRVSLNLAQLARNGYIESAENAYLPVAAPMDIEVPCQIVSVGDRHPFCTNLSLSETHVSARPQNSSEKAMRFGVASRFFIGTLP